MPESKPLMITEFRMCSSLNVDLKNKKQTEFCGRDITKVSILIKEHHYLTLFNKEKGEAGNFLEGEALLEFILKKNLGKFLFPYHPDSDKPVNKSKQP